jgi:hypothetical protein
MRPSITLALAAFMATAFSVPALADWDRIGSVDFGWQGDHQSQWGDFGGRVERLNFRAEGNDVRCRSVRATFGNGNTREIFNGWIREGDSATVDLPGYQRNVRRLDFFCRARGGRNARLQIAADIGQYRSEWENGPDWANHWSGMFHWGGGNDQMGGGHDHFGGGFDRDRWVQMGSESFEGGYDHEVAYGGWAGRRVDTIAIMPVNADARCRRVTATFNNGHTRELDISAWQDLRQGGFYRLDLPGRERDVRRVNLVCRPVHSGQVTIEIYASK